MRHGKIIRTTITFILAAAMVFGAVPVSVVPDMPEVQAAEPEWAGGNGIREAPYLISTPKQLLHLAEYCAESEDDLRYEYFALKNDIDLSGTEGYTPIGDSDNPFGGKFDGRGFTISGIHIQDNGTSYNALFGYVNNNGRISNLNVSGSVNADNHCAGIVSFLDGGRITGCRNEASITSGGGERNGGIVAEIISGTVTGCENTGLVTGGSHSGGIAGSNGGTITECINRGRIEVTWAKNEFGGIAGDTSGTISDCLNYGEIRNLQEASTEHGPYHPDIKRSYLGGIAGYMNDGMICRCNNYAEYLVLMTNFCNNHGGICGYADRGRIEDCANYGDFDGGFATSRGGILGAGEGTIISGCYNDGLVAAICSTEVGLFEYYAERIGGIVGSLKNGKITGCRNTGRIDAHREIGGIAGRTLNTDITYCQNEGRVEAEYPFYDWWTQQPSEQPECYDAGGIVGYCIYNDLQKPDPSKNRITDCMNTARITAYANAGGIVGYTYKGSALRLTRNVSLGEVKTNKYYTMEDGGLNNKYVYYRGMLIGRSHYIIEYPQYSFFNNKYDDSYGDIDEIGSSSHYSLTDSMAEDLSAWETVQPEYYDGFDLDKVWKIGNNDIGLRNSVLYPEAKDGVLNISNATDLIRFRDRVNSGWDFSGITVRLSNDIDLSGMGSFTPIGDGEGSSYATLDPRSAAVHAFNGVFDGNGHSITGLNVSAGETSRCAGLFGIVRNGTVKDLSVSGTVDSKGIYGNTGGVAGYLFYSNLERCSFSGTIEGGDNTGGIAGNVDSGKIIECAVTGTEISGRSKVGGIAGSMKETDAIVKDCLHEGEVSGLTAAGGIVGSQNGGLVTACCHYTGNITGTAGAGGVAGKVMKNNAVTNCYYLSGTVSSLESVTSSQGDHGIGGIEDSQGKAWHLTKDEFKAQGSFSGFDFNNVWRMDGLRPALKAIGSTRIRYVVNREILPMPDCGRITIEPDSGFMGDEISVYYDAGGGFKLESMTVTDSDGNEVSAEKVYGDSHYAKYKFLMPGSNADVTLLFQPVLNLKGRGTQTVPFEIKDNDDWEDFADYVNNGGNTAGVYFRMTEDIEAYEYIGTRNTDTKMAGTEQFPFEGVFDGDGHRLRVDVNGSNGNYAGPFGCIRGAVIRGLTVDGMISNGNCCGGIAGGAFGEENRIENCAVTANIASGSRRGGILGFAQAGTEMTFDHCVFVGNLQNVQNASDAASVCGYSDGAEVHLENCLDVSEKGVPIGRGSVSENSTVTHTYYYGSTGSTGWPDNLRGLRAYRIIPGSQVQAELSGSAGMEWDGRLYAASGENVRLDLTYVPSESEPEGMKQNGFFARPGALGRDLNIGDWILAMPGADTTIEPYLVDPEAMPLDLSGKGTAGDPWQISSDADWEKLAAYVNNQNGETAGRYFKLTFDVTVTKMVGTLQKPFAGIFDGNGRTMTLNLRPASDAGLVAPFRYIDGATIRNLKINGGNEGNPGVQANELASGLVGKVLGGPNLIEGCEITAGIGSKQSITDVAGFVAHGGSAKTTIRNCVFNGALSWYCPGVEAGSAFWADDGGSSVFLGGADEGAFTVLEHCLILTRAKAWQGEVEPAVQKGVYLYTGNYVNNTNATRGYPIMAGENVDISVCGELGFVYEDKIIAGKGESVELSLSCPTLQQGTEVFYVETKSPGEAKRFTLSKNGAIYTLSLPEKEQDLQAAGTITIKAKEKTYSVVSDNGISNGTVIPSVSEARPGDTVTLTVTPDEDHRITSVNYNDVREHTVTLKDGVYSFTMPDHDVTVSAVFDEKEAITPILAFEGWTYGDTEPHVPELTGNDGGGTVTYEYKVLNAADNTYSYAVPTDKGEYTIRATVAETGKYKSGTATADFTISPAAWINNAAEVTVKAGEEGSIDLAPYIAPGGKADTENIVRTSVSDCSVDSTTLTFTALDTDGSITVPVIPDTAGMNYASYSITVTVKITDLNTQNLIFADARANKTYGDENFANTVSGAQTAVNYEVTSGSDTASVDPSTGEVTVKDIGTAIIKATAAANDEYAGASASYVMTVGRKAVTVSANDMSKTAGEDDPEFTATVNGTVGSDTLDYEVIRSAGETVGTYDITPAGETVQGNYHVRYIPGIFTITEATHTVTVTDNGLGTAEADPASGVIGTKVTLSANSAADCHFKEWEVISGRVTVRNNWFTIGNSDVEIRAVFEKDTPEPPEKYIVTVNGGMGSGEYVEGESVVIMANNPESGKRFKEWTGADDLVFTLGKRTSAGAVFTMPAREVTVTATYEDEQDPTPPGPHKHSYTSQVTTYPTCTGKGVRTFICACGDSYTEEIQALGHNYVDEITKEPSTTEEGVRTFTCTRCKDSYTEAIPKLNEDLLLYENVGGKYELRVSKKVSTGAAFTLVPKFADGRVLNQRVVWYSSDPGVATVTQDGKVTARSGGLTTMTVRSEEDPGLTAYCHVSVTDPVTTVTLDRSSYTFGVGESVTLTARVLPFTAKQNLNWTKSNDNINIKVSEDGSGVTVTAVRAGTAKVSATAEDESRKKAECSFTIGNPVPDFTIAGKDKKTNVQAGKTLNMIVDWGGKKLTPKNTDITWSVAASDGGNASAVAAISSKGVLTGITAGRVIVTATSMANPEKAASTEITVTAPAESKGAKVTGISFTNKETLEKDGLITGRSFTAKTKLDLSGKGRDASDAVAWFSSDTSVATVSKKGVIKAVAPGTVTVTAVTRDAVDLSTAPRDSVTFNVYARVKSIKPDRNRLTVGTQDATRYGLVSIAAIVPDNASDMSVKWTAGNKNVRLAAVPALANPSTGSFAEAGAEITTKQGEALAVMGVAPGIVKLTGTATDGSKKKVTCNVTVRGQVTGLNLKARAAKNGVNDVTPADNKATSDIIEYTGTMKSKGKMTLTPVIEINGLVNSKDTKKTYTSYRKYTDVSVSYRSSDTSVATVNRNGKISVKKGQSGKTVTIHAASADGRYKAELLITVK